MSSGLSSAPLSAEAIDKINETHAEHLTRILKAKLRSYSDDADVDEGRFTVPENVPGSDLESDLERRQPQNNHNHIHGAANDRVGDLLTMPEGSRRKEVSIKEIAASADAQHNAVLTRPFFVNESTNRENAFVKHVLEMLPMLLCTVPVRCKDFYLLPEQRLAIIAMITALPVDVFVNCEIPREAMEMLTPRGSRKMPFSVRYRLEKYKMPTFAIADHCTGSGKTIMAVMAALSLLCCKIRWKALKTSFRGLLEDRTREEHSGLCKIDDTANARLARLAIMFVPATTLSHWYKTAQSAVFGCKETFGPATDVIVWRGLSGSDKNMKEALDCGRPVLWILPMESESMQAVRKSPNIHYAVRIFDELNVVMRSRYDQPESMAIYNYVTQATIEALETSTAGNPRAPLRLAFKGNFSSIARAPEAMRGTDYKKVQEMLDHFCKMKVFAAPDFVRTAVSDAVQANMPRGIVVNLIQVRSGTLAAMATGSDMIKISLPDLATRILGNGVEKGVRDKIKTLFARAEAVCTEELIKELTDAHDVLPLLTMADNHAKQAVKRLVERMTDLFSGTFPNCPITLEPIPRERVRILPCCTAILDAESLPGCRNRCPLCRATIACVGEIKPEASPEPVSVDAALGGQPNVTSTSNAEGVNGKRPSTSEGKKPLKQQKLACGSPSLRNGNDSESDDENERPVPMPAPPSAIEAFEANLVEIDASTPYSVDGVLDVMKAQVRLEPSSRMLLCFGFESAQRPVVRQIAARIEQEIDEAFVLDVENVVKDYQRMDVAMARFNNRTRFPRPHVFMVNTTATSSSVQGLDLYNTDLTVIADNTTIAIQRQAVGRSLRMRPLPSAAVSDFRFPAKRVVVLRVLA